MSCSYIGDHANDWTQVHGCTFWPLFDAEYLRQQRPMLGLARRVWPNTVSDIPPRTPFGWRRMQEPHRIGFVYVPAWLYWLMQLWRRITS